MTSNQPGEHCDKCKGDFAPDFITEACVFCPCHQEPVQARYKFRDGGICTQCSLSECICPERQSDGSWKSQQEPGEHKEGWREDFDGLKRYWSYTEGEETIIEWDSIKAFIASEIEAERVRVLEEAAQIAESVRQVQTHERDTAWHINQFLEGIAKMIRNRKPLPDTPHERQN